MKKKKAKKRPSKALRKKIAKVVKAGLKPLLPRKRKRPSTITMPGKPGPGGFDVVVVPNPDTYKPPASILDLRKAASKIPGIVLEVRPDSWVRPGRYEMRNGSRAIVMEPVTLKFGIQMRQTWHGWKGFLEGHPDGEKLVWGCDGKRSDAAPLHEHDLIRRSKNQKGAPA